MYMFGSRINLVTRKSSPQTTSITPHTKHTQPFHLLLLDSKKERTYTKDCASKPGFISKNKHYTYISNIQYTSRIKAKNTFKFH